MRAIPSLAVLAASMVLAGAVLAQQAPDVRYVETGKDFRQADRVTMGGDLITEDERRAFDERRKAAGNNRQELDRIEAEESTLLNQRVADKINAALSPANVTGPGQSPGMSERPPQ